MTRSKFPDPTALPHDSILDVLKLNRRAQGAADAKKDEPVTFVGRYAHQQNLSIQERIERLEAERSDGMVLMRLDPKTVGRTEFANRHILSLADTDEDLRRLKASILQNGQDTPIRVRPTPAGSPYEYELAEGHRRHAACLELDRETEGGFPILARLDAGTADTRDLVLKMYRENEERKDLSPYEKGAMFRTWLASGIFTRQADIAEAIGSSEVTILKYVQVADLPAEVLAAFGDPRTISLRWIQDLIRALKANRTAVIAAAERLQAADPRPAPEAILRMLVDSTTEARKSSASREEAVKINGKVAFRIARRDGRLTLKYGVRVDKAVQRELAEEIKELAEGRLKDRLKGR